MRRLMLMTLLAVTATCLHAEQVTITGRIVGPDGAPIAGAHVGVRDGYADRGQQWTSVTTAEDGGFTLVFDAGRVMDSYGIAATADGFGLGGADAEPGESVEIALPEEGVPITGMVVDADGAPIGGAEVSVWGIPGGTGPFGRVGTLRWDYAPRDVTGEDGRFTISGLPPNTTAQLRTDADGYAGQHPTRRENWTKTGAAVRIELQREAIISGRLTRDGEPLEGVRIGAQGQTRSGSIGGGDGVADADGAYTIRGLSSGTYNVIVDAPPEWTAVAREGVTVEAGQQVGDVNLEAIEGVVVRGTVTWEDTGDPIADAGIGAYGPAHPFTSAWVQRAETDEDGRYQMRLPPGRNRVYVMGTPEGGRDREPSEYRKEIAAGDEPVFDFSITRAPGLVLRVVNPDGTPAPGVDVYWSAGDEMPAMALEPRRTDARGEVAVLSRSRDRMGALAFALDEERGLVAATVVASAEDAGREIVLTLQQAATASISAIDGDAAPVTDAVFRVWFDDASPDVVLPINLRANADGVAEIAPLPPGIRMRIGPARQFGRYLANREQAWQRVTLQPGETVALEPLTVIRGGFTLRGRVIDEAGEPVTGARLQPLDLFSWGGEPVVADADGRFELKGLSGARDQAIVAVSADGTRGMLTPVDPQNAYQPNIELAPLGTIVVEVRAADDRPAVGAQVEVIPQGAPMIGGLPEPAIIHAPDVTLDADGKARVEHLLPGITYIVVVNDPARPGHFLTPQEQVTLHGGEEPIEVTIDLGGAN